MKKKRIACLFAALPLTLLCACGEVPKLSFSPYWHKNATVNAPDNTLEKLTYAVTFKPDEDLTSGISVAYEEGSYVTELVAKSLQVEEKTEICYVYTTEFSITGKYTVNGVEGDSFTDSVKTSVTFRNIERNLRPIESLRDCVSTYPRVAVAPNGAQPKDIVQTDKYTYAVKYDLELKNAQTALKLNDRETEEVTIKDLSKKGTYLDNEQSLFAMRGLPLNGGFVYYTINQPLRKVSQVQASVSEQNEVLKFTVDGEEINREIPACKVTFSYNEQIKGLSQSATFAKLTNATDNALRNVMLKMETPMMYSLGTFTYRLKNASFTKNA